jgi:hypothetical protein
MKILKQLVRVSIRDCLCDYVIRKPLEEMGIVKDTEKYGMQWRNKYLRMDVKKPSHYMPGQPQKFPRVSGSQISRQNSTWW